MASPQAEMFKSTVREFRAAMEASGASGPLSIEDLRASDATMGDITVEPEGVDYEPGRLGGVAGLWATPQDTDLLGTILFLHGGGYVIGSSATHRKMVGHLAKACGCRAFLADYRLGPEHPHPAAVEDALAVYRALLDDGGDPHRIVLAGDSAGGGLVFALLVAARDAGERMPAAALGMSPWVDLAVTGTSALTRAAVDLMVTPELTHMMADLYLGEQDRRTPSASPLYADVHGLPPCCIQVGDEETLLDDSLRLTDRLRAAGVEVDLEVFPEMQHVFQLAAGFLPESDDAIAKLGRYARARLA